MKTYDSNETLKWSWLKKQDYISSSDAIGDGSQIGWKLIEKFQIQNIIHDESNYPNKINQKEVIQMIEEFYPVGFYPLRIKKNGILLDGQHRLKFAQLCGLKYIDVWIDNSNN
jgi:hypothetical protein